MGYPPLPESNPTTWDVKLAKHRSLPELQLRTDFRVIYDDNRSRNASADQRARRGHACLPRVRYTSAPVPVLLQLSVRHQSLIGPHDGPKIQGKTRPTTNCAAQQGVTHLDSTNDYTYSESLLSRQDLQRPFTVATATPPVALQLAPSLKRSHSLLRHTCKQTQDSQSPRDPVFDSGALSRLSITSQSSSVDRSDSWPSPMTVRKPSRSIKASRRNLAIGLDYNDPKKTSLSIDNDVHDIFKEIISSNPNDQSYPTSSKPFSTLSPKLRRRKRLSIGRTSSIPEPTTVKPIAISLTFSSPPTPNILSPKASTAALSDHATPAETDSESKDKFDATTSRISAGGPIQDHGLPERRASPSMSSPPSTPSSASTSLHPAPTNVRLGHPSRPYYSAIRKQGISPPSSRRSSIKDAVHSPTRPKSYSPPSPLPASKTAPGSSAQRHLSLSAVSHPSSFISAFSLDDDSDDNPDDELPVIPLTPVASGRMSFGTSLASVAKSLTRKRSMSGPSTFSASSTSISKYSRSISPSSQPLAFPLSAAQSSFSTHHQANVKGKGFRMSSPSTGSGASGIGFSVSGETELKMALAFSEAKTKTSAESNTGVSVATPVIQEEEDSACAPTEQSPPLRSASSSTSPSPISQSSLQLPSFSNSRNSIANRVKKLRQGLKDMLLMTTYGSGNNTNSTTTTTTTTTN